MEQNLNVGPKSHSKPHSRPYSKPRSKTHSKPPSKPNSKPRSKINSKPRPKTHSKPPSKPHSKPRSKLPSNPQYPDCEGPQKQLSTDYHKDKEATKNKTTTTTTNQEAEAAVSAVSLASPSSSGPFMKYIYWFLKACHFSFLLAAAMTFMILVIEFLFTNENFDLLKFLNYFITIFGCGFALYCICDALNWIIYRGRSPYDFYGHEGVSILETEPLESYDVDKMESSSSCAKNDAQCPKVELKSILSSATKSLNQIKEHVRVKDIISKYQRAQIKVENSNVIGSKAFFRQPTLCACVSHEDDTYYGPQYCSATNPCEYHRAQQKTAQDLSKQLKETRIFANPSCHFIFPNDVPPDELIGSGKRPQKLVDYISSGGNRLLQRPSKLLREDSFKSARQIVDTDKHIVHERIVQFSSYTPAPPSETARHIQTLPNGTKRLTFISRENSKVIVPVETSQDLLDDQYQ